MRLVLFPMKASEDKELFSDFVGTARLRFADAAMFPLQPPSTNPSCQCPVPPAGLAGYPEAATPSPPEPGHRLQNCSYTQAVPN